MKQMKAQLFLLCLSQIPGGKREQTGYVHGVIFKKNIAHKKMSQHLSNPRTLLMNGSIEYQRVENKMSSLQPQILQEEEFLRKGIAKIAALKPKPDILIVEKSVGRLAQDFLLENGITLIYNVKLVSVVNIKYLQLMTFSNFYAALRNQFRVDNSCELSAVPDIQCQTGR